MYVGASPCRALKVRTAILYLIRYLIGNQCKLYSTGVIGARLLILDRSLAAAFWIDWSRAIGLCIDKDFAIPIPYRSLLIDPIP